MSAMPAISVRGLRKEYRSRQGRVTAVDGLDLEVTQGEVYALLGHNGAGKTTAIEILEGHRDRTSGEVSVLGVDPARSGHELRQRIGVVLQTAGLEPELSVTEVLDITRRCYRRSRSVAEVIELVGLGEQASARIGTLSGGQARRVAIGLGIIGAPEVLFLDEPTTGLDPQARRNLWDLIAALSAEGTTVLLTTHYLDEAEQVAHRVGVMASGSLIAEGTPAALIASHGRSTVRFDLESAEQWREQIAAVVGGAVTITASGRVEIASSAPTADLAALTGWAHAQGLELGDLEVVRSTLEDVFLELGGER